MSTAGQPTAVALASIRRDPKLSCRALGINERTVAEYAESMRAGAVFPPVVVFRDRWNTHWLADGFHRTAAAELAGLAEIAADVRDGGQKDAILHAASANSVHGLRRTNADKRRAVELVLKGYPKWSDRQIGEACGVDHKTVAAARRAIGEIPQRADGAEKGRGAPLFDAERELARLERMLGALFDRWPNADTSGRERLRVALVSWEARLSSEVNGTKPQARERRRASPRRPLKGARPC